MRADIPYKVVGGTRFYDRQEIKDALAYLRAVVNPADEVSHQAGAQRAQAGRRRHLRRQARRLGHRPRHLVPGGAAPGRRGRGQGPGRHRHRVFLELLDDVADLAMERARPAAPAVLERSRVPRPSWSPSAPIEAEGRLENLAELVGRGQRGRVRRAFLEQISLVADTDDLDDDTPPSSS